MPEGPGGGDGERARFLSTIPTRLEVLSRVRATLDEAPGEAAAAATRLASVLLGEGERLGFPGVVEGARAILEAGNEAMAPALDTLEAVLRPLAAPGVRRSILVVEDEPTTALLVTQALGSDGNRVRVASSAREARIMVEEEVPDAIVLDLVLPDVDGRGLLAEFRQSPATRDCAVVVLSASGGPVPRAECLAYGADLFLEKPLDPAALSGAVESLLSRRSGRVGAGSLDRLPSPPQLVTTFQRLQADRRERGGGLTLGLLDVDVVPGRSAETDSPELSTRLRELVDALGERLGPEEVLGRWSVDQLLLLSPGRTPAESAALQVEMAGAFPWMQTGLRVGIRTPAPAEEFIDALSRVAALLAHTASGGERIRVEAVEPEGRPTVILAEDDPITVVLVRHRLEKSGFHVEHRADGAEALKLILESPPTVAILDIQMPGMDGFEVLARLRNDPRTRELPTLILTSLGRDADLRRAFDRGADDYLTKPFSPGELLARVLRLIRAR